MSDLLWRMLEESDIDGKYYLEKLLGSGSYGGVFLANEFVGDHFIRQVAVKLITPDADQQKRTEQLQELIAAVNLQHPNLVRCFVPGQCTIRRSDFLYLVMELAEGTLQGHMDKTKTLPVAEVEEIVKAIASALVYLHGERNPIVHRDLKPGNILRVGNCWKLSDFGLLRAMNSQKSERTNNQNGTHGYSPPESYDRVVAVSWDIWSLGVMIAEMLTGQFPFTGKTNEQLMAQVMKEPPSIDWSKIPEPLAEIVKGCLEKDRNKRPTAAKVLDAVTTKISTASKIEPVVPTAAKVLDAVTRKISTARKIEPEVPPSILKGKTTATPWWSIFAKNVTPNIDVLREFTFKVVTVDGKGKINHRETKQASYFTEDLGTDITLEMVYIPKGSFNMGAPASEAESNDSQRPQHQVTIKPFLMGKYPITQAQWAAVAKLPKIKYDLKPDLSCCKGNNRPVEMVSWYHAVEFCARLSRKTGSSYRLPSEAEWEYACRAGTTTPFHFGETITTDLANYNGNYIYAAGPKGIDRYETTPVGSFGVANAFGLYDMHGNVWECCADPWHENYDGAPTDGSVWDETCNDNRYHDSMDLLVKSEGKDNRSRLLRGGSWYDSPQVCRSACRVGVAPDFAFFYIGFRVVCVAAWT